MQDLWMLKDKALFCKLVHHMNHLHMTFQSLSPCPNEQLPSFIACSLWLLLLAHFLLWVGQVLHGQRDDGDFILQTFPRFQIFPSLWFSWFLNWGVTDKFHILLFPAYCTCKYIHCKTLIDLWISFRIQKNSANGLMIWHVAWWGYGYLVTKKGKFMVFVLCGKNHMPYIVWS